ncbi:MAG: periplasmic heavy metal sensor [Firmicutes bacterium]|nr:periplasmic heavy metal sensor [Bacillota bacterium]
MALWRVWVLTLFWLLSDTIAAGVLAQGAPPPPPPPRGMWGQPPPAPTFDREAMFNYLNLTAQQRTRLTALMNEFEEKMRQLLSRLHEQRMQLLKLYGQYQFDERAAQRIIQTINQTQAELLKMHHDHQKQLRRILDKEQFERWTQWWKERMSFPPPKGDWGRRGRDRKPG